MPTYTPPDDPAFEWEVQGYFTDAYGWERVTTEQRHADALAQLETYRDNDPKQPYRVRRVAVVESSSI